MKSAIIVAAGRGTRMGPGVDKIFLEIAGMPVVAHTWLAFDRCPFISDLIIVVRDGLQQAFEEMKQRLRCSLPVQFVAGGKERQDSVWNGLEALRADAKFVAIQDAARPCTSPELIARTFQAAEESGAAVAASPVVDTIKESRDGRLIDGTVDRSRLFAVQTPQTFQVSVIRRALAEVRSRGLAVTDDTAACELIGQKVQLVLSSEPNLKVTRPEDVPLISFILAQKREPSRSFPAIA